MALPQFLPEVRIIAGKSLITEYPVMFAFQLLLGIAHRLHEIFIRTNNLSVRLKLNNCQ
ncbi:hypothetical protein BQ6471_01981 [Vibrio gazogenes]|nr:hypothetical protein BQ6471_01981 [Vibrio gazogenes]